MRRDNSAESANLRAELEKLVSEDAAHRLFAIEAIVRPTFEAFPKNSAGKIPMQAMHSIARSYFAEEHGWMIKGFEFVDAIGAKPKQLHSSQILHKRAPQLAQALSEGHRLEIGLSLSDLVLVVAALEHLILDESTNVLSAAFTLHGISSEGELDARQVAEVLESFMVLFRRGVRSDLANATQHKLDMAIAEVHSDWGKLVTYVANSIESHRQDGSFSYGDVSQIMRDMLLRYGKWQNSECVEMRDKLVSLQLPGTGRVPFALFHEQPENEHYSFRESVEYLRQLNALDEAEEGNPKVLIANYLASPSNCIASSEFFSVCCLNECERLFNDLEIRLQSSDVSLKQLFAAVRETSSNTVAAPRELSANITTMAERLSLDGSTTIPIHSGEFRRWFHHVFPNECPFPTSLDVAAEEAMRAAADRWLGRNRAPAWQVNAVGESIQSS